VGRAVRGCGAVGGGGVGGRVDMEKEVGGRG